MNKDDLGAAVAGLVSLGTKKFRTARALIAISEKNPAALYPFFDEFRRLLGAGNGIIKWSAQQIVANLACAADEGLISGMLDTYLAPIRGTEMIAAANAIAGGARIASAHPALAAKVASAVLGVEKARYKTAECGNVAIGKAIDALGAMGDGVRRSKPVIAFVKRQARNRRAAMRRRAEAFLDAIR